MVKRSIRKASELLVTLFPDTEIGYFGTFTLKKSQDVYVIFQ